MTACFAYSRCCVGVRVGRWIGSERCGVRWAQAHMSAAKTAIAQTWEFVSDLSSGRAGVFQMGCDCNRQATMQHNE